MIYNENETILRESWKRFYDSAIFGKYTLIFKIYEENNKFTIQIENSLTNNVYNIKNKFNDYDEAVDCMGHIKDNLININNEELIELMQ